MVGAVIDLPLIFAAKRRTGASAATGVSEISAVILE
jgi:hypothetical protein